MLTKRKPGRKTVTMKHDTPPRVRRRATDSFAVRARMADAMVFLLLSAAVLGWVTYSINRTIAFREELFAQCAGKLAGNPRANDIIQAARANPEQLSCFGDINAEALLQGILMVSFAITFSLAVMFAASGFVNDYYGEDVKAAKRINMTSKMMLLTGAPTALMVVSYYMP